MEEVTRSGPAQPFPVGAAVATAVVVIPASAALAFGMPEPWQWLSIVPTLAYLPFYVRAWKIRCRP